MNELPLVLKVDDVAKELGVSRQAVYRLIAKAELPVLQSGGKGHAIRISRVQLREWMSLPLRCELCGEPAGAGNALCPACAASH